MTKAYAITADAIAQETARSGNDLTRFDISKVVTLDELELEELSPTKVYMRILAVSAEHNVAHAALADTVNIAEALGGKIYPGNSATAEVVSVGSMVTDFAPGDIVITHSSGAQDEWGYMLRAWAYDQPDSVGWYAEEAVVDQSQIIKAPLDCGLNLWEIAALPLRAPTAYHLWRRAIGIYRVKIPAEHKSRVTVLGFGGGVSELLLMLAQNEGHRAIFCSGTPERRAHLEAMGIETIDQQKFNRFATSADIKAFYNEVRGIVDGGVEIVCDLLRGPVFDAGLRVMARGGVNVSAGWQLSREARYNNANLAVRQITLDHVHYETIVGCATATELYGSVFKPTVHHEIYSFEDLPRALHELHQNVQTGIPIVQMTTDMPEAVKHLIP
jgi:NADPH:quinone reductase-like Zn-dependent oxidoreductase